MLEILEERHWYYKHRFKWTSDWELYNKSDHWTYPQVINTFFGGKIYKGDCEDYCFQIARDLKEYDIKVNLICCLTERKQGHAVLDYQGYIIDVRQPSVMTRQDLNYEYILTSSMNGKAWRKIIDEIAQNRLSSF